MDSAKIKKSESSTTDRRANQGELHAVKRQLLIVLVFCASPMAALVITAISPALPALAEHFAYLGDGAFIAQMLMTLPDISLVLGGLTSGWIIERMGERRVTLTALLIYAGAGSLPMITDNIVLLMASRICVGFGAALFVATSLSILTTNFHGEQRKRLLGFKGGIAALVGFISFPAAGMLVADIGWRGAFAIYTVAIPVFLLAVYVLRDSHQRADGVVRDKASFAHLKPAWVLLLIILVASLLSGNTTIQGPFALVSRGTDDPRIIGWIVAASALAASAGNFAYAIFARRYPVKGLCVLTFSFMAIGYVVFYFSHVWVLWTAAFTLCGFGFGLLTPVILNAIIDRVAPAVHAHIGGYFFSAIFIGQLINPVAFTPIRDMLGPLGPFLVAAPLLLIIGISTLLLDSARHESSS